VFDKVVEIFLITVIVQSIQLVKCTETHMETAIWSSFWFGVVVKVGCTSFTQPGHVLHLAVSAFLALLATGEFIDQHNQF
jgi:hypothetical protein